jgi:hypothetical protein
MPKSVDEMIKQADAEFARAHPELKGRELSLGPEDAALREEWKDLLVKEQGEISEADLEKVPGGVAASRIVGAASRVMRGF